MLNRRIEKQCLSIIGLKEGINIDILFKSALCILASLVFSFLATGFVIGATMSKKDMQNIEGPFILTMLTVTAFLSWFLIKFGVLTGIF
jgi:hypothetical protein